jgi:uncharacterized protein
MQDTTTRAELVQLEMASDDVEDTEAFYRSLFGWEFVGSGAVVMAQLGGVRDLTATVKENPGRGHLPSHWTPYLRVADVRETTERARQLGASVLHEPQEIPGGHGIASIVLDPVGAPLALWQDVERPAADAPAPAEIIKTIRYSLATGVNDADFLKASTELVDELRSLNGFLGRRLLRGDDGSWDDVVHWRTRADADRSENEISALACCRACIALMDPDSIVVSHADLVQRSDGGS